MGMTQAAQNNAAKTNETPTMWKFYGLFFGGEVDRAGTPIGDICTGYGVTAGADQAQAEAAIVRRYAANAGRFELRNIQACPNAKVAAAKFRRGGTKDCPVLA